MSGIKHTNIGNRRRNLSRFSVMLSAFAAMVLVAMLVILCRMDNVKVSQSRNDIGFEQMIDNPLQYVTMYLEGSFQSWIDCEDNPMI